MVVFGGKSPAVVLQELVFCVDTLIIWDMQVKTTVRYLTPQSLAHTLLPNFPTPKKQC